MIKHTPDPGNAGVGIGKLSVLRAHPDAEMV
jgi:hypothetical protein